MSTGEKLPTKKTTDPEASGAYGGATPPAAASLDAAHGMSIVPRTQAQLVRRRFFRHRAAMISLTILILVILLAFTSI